MLQDSPETAALLLQWQAAWACVQTMDTQTAEWHSDPDPEKAGLLLELHRANFDLWHLEDQARDPNATDQAIARVKRAIDQVNQGRNDTVERIDTALLTELAAHALPRDAAALHSETPGQMFDRLSILSLKVFHTAEELHRTETSQAHRDRNRRRLTVLQEQRNDLCQCLAELHAQVMLGERRFKQYRQFKMYNDPDLNPVLYQAGTGTPIHKPAGTSTLNASIPLT